MNTTANALLAIGASPAMVHALPEVEDFAPLAQALVINIGTLSPPWVEAMERAAGRRQRRGRALRARPGRRRRHPLPHRGVAAASSRFARRSSAAMPRRSWRSPARPAPPARASTSTRTSEAARDAAAAPGPPGAVRRRRDRRRRLRHRRRADDRHRQRRPDALPRHRHRLHGDGALRRLPRRRPPGIRCRRRRARRRWVSPPSRRSSAPGARRVFRSR